MNPLHAVGGIGIAMLIVSILFVLWRVWVARYWSAEVEDFLEKHYEEIE